jgi:methanethiol S-methyltransferase
MDYAFLSLLWGGYCFLHSYLISISFTGILTRILKRYYAFYRLFYIIISVLLLIPLINYSQTFNNTLVIEYAAPWSVIRIIILISAVLFFFWAFLFDYDPLSFFGIRQIIEFYKGKEINASGGIKKSGLLGVVRHPMYLALLVFLWCQTFTTTDILVNIILTIYVITGTFIEERKLLLEFGQAYEVYQDQVPMLIPFTKLRRHRFA